MYISTTFLPKQHSREKTPHEGIRFFMQSKARDKTGDEVKLHVFMVDDLENLVKRTWQKGPGKYSIAGNKYLYKVPDPVGSLCCLFTHGQSMFAGYQTLHGTGTNGISYLKDSFIYCQD